MIQGLTPPDSHHLRAAEGWLGLGNSEEAAQELAKLASPLLSHPQVLGVTYQLYENTRQWERAAETAELLCQIVPEAPLGWIHLAYALHELKRTREAYNVLLPVVNRFPDAYVIRYNLACYCCQLGELEESRVWLQQAIAVVGSDTIKAMAADDPDLQLLKEEIRQL
jgi:tetratricopeptide (TPR) repeat protein